MSGGSGGSGGDGGARGGGDARDAAQREPQSLDSPVDRTPAPSPDLAVQRAAEAVAAGGGTVETKGFWLGTRPLGFWPSSVYCGCIAEDAGGGWRIENGAACGTHPDLRGLKHCRHVTRFAVPDDSRGIWWTFHPHCPHYFLRHLCRFL